MESSAQLQQRGDPAVNHNATFHGIGQTCNQTKQSALARAIPSHYGQAFAILHSERDIAQREELLLTVLREQVPDIRAQ